MLNRAFAGLCARFLQQQHKQLKTTTKFGPNAKKVYVFWNFSASIELQALEISHSSRSKMTICKWPFLGKKFLRPGFLNSDFTTALKTQHQNQKQNKTGKFLTKKKSKQTNRGMHQVRSPDCWRTHSIQLVKIRSRACIFLCVCVFVLCFLSSRFPFARCQAKQTKRVRSFLSRFDVCILDCAPYGN